ncbi:hypothetical protein KIPB_014749, partial [Kipferlia bialata]|eukprot:g14749.t1
MPRSQFNESIMGLLPPEEGGYETLGATGTTTRGNPTLYRSIHPKTLPEAQKKRGHATI